MRDVRRHGTADVTLVVCDTNGVWHEVYNKTEIAEARMGHRDWVENWQVRTLCCKDEEPAFLEAGIRRATIDDSVRTGHAPTCVRCAAMPCDHGITFDLRVAFNLSSDQVRRRWPRLNGLCPKGCGYDGVYYASYIHYIYGDW